MNAPSQSPARPPPSTDDERLAEAARYALLRRIAPALRHHMVGAMQPLGMIAAMIERRVQAAAPDMASIQKKSAEMAQLSREATNTCVGLIGWISPRQAETVDAGAGVRDCLHVLETDLALRGYTVANEIADGAGDWPREALRNTLCAALLALTDGAKAPAQVRLTTQPAATGPVLSATLQAKEGEPISGVPPGWRALDWRDVEAIANAESIDATRSDDGFALRQR